MVEEKGTSIWKILLISLGVSAVSTLGLYYTAHPEKFSHTKKYFLKKLGYDLENIKKSREEGVSEEELNRIVEEKVYNRFKKYFPNV